MLFNSLGFLVFLAVMLGVYWALRGTRRQNLWLLAGSLFFYGYADYRYLGLLLISTVASWLAAIGIEKFPVFRRSIAWAGIAVCLSLLLVFKYHDFFVVAVADALASMGFPIHPVTLRLALPIGISFFTFQAIGYIVDVWRGNSRAERDFANYFLFKAFFPQLVAGPIERSTNLLRQIKNPRRLAPGDITYGVWYMLQGYLKKVVIADNLAPMVNLLFAQGGLDGGLVLAGLLGFAFQIYGDFSGYTDIARGVARLFGFRLLVNFWHPYAARNPADFWSRWHITLSSWFRDYVYIPLGGNRRSGFRTYTNLMATMMLSGLWHGASFNFILWGAYHGLLLAAHRFARAMAGGRPGRGGLASRALSWLAMFLLTLYGWMLFRITDVDRIAEYTIALFTDWRAPLLALLVLGQMSVFIGIAIVLDFVESRVVRRERHKLAARWWLSPAYALMSCIILIYIASDSAEFIYFRF